MQESVVDEQDAERLGASWYLSRNGEQLGPLTERELSLFAEGGNFMPGDLLWTAGLDGWKPADAIFGLASSGEAEDAGEQAATEEATPEKGDTGEPKDAEFIVDPVDGATSGDADADGATPGETSEGDGSEIAGESQPEAGTDAVFLAPVAEPAVDTDGRYHAATHLDAAHLDATHLDAAHFDGHDPHADHLDGGHLDGSHLDGGHPDGDHPTGEHVSALVQALKGEAESTPLTLKAWFFTALKKFAGAGAYLWAVFALLALHAWLGEAQFGPGLGFFVFTTINAFLAFQLMGFAERLRLVQDLRQKPLIYSILYKTVTFGALVFAVYGLELMVFGLLGGGGLGAGGGLLGTLTLWLIFSIAMLPYFAFKAFERAVGADMIAKLLFGKS